MDKINLSRPGVRSLIFILSSIFVLVPIVGLAQSKLEPFYRPSQGFTQLAFLEPAAMAPSLYNGYHVKILVRNRTYIEKNYSLEISENGIVHRVENFSLAPDEKIVFEQVVWKWPRGEMKVALKGTPLFISAIVRGNN